MSAVIMYFGGRDSLAGPDLAGGCLQDVQFPDASLYENSCVAFRTQQAHYVHTVLGSK